MACADSAHHQNIHAEPESPKPERPFWLVVGTLGAIAALGGLSWLTINAFLPFISEDLGYSVPVLGQITTIVVLLGAVLGLIGGPLADRYGQRLFLLIGALSVVVTAAGTALATDFGVLLLARLVSAFAVGLLAGTPMAMAATLYAGPQRRKAISGVLAGMSGGPVIGLPTLTYIGSLTSWRVAFVTLAVIGVAAIVLLMLVLPGSPDAQAKRPPIRVAEVLSAYRPLLADKNMRPLYLASLFRSVCWMAVLLYFGAFLRHSFNAEADAIGFAFMAAGSGYFAGSFAAGSWLKNVPLRPLYGIGAFTMGPAIIIAMAVPISVTVSAALLTVAAIVSSASNVCLTTLLADESSAGSTTTQGLNTAVAGLATAVGGAIGGALIVVGGYALLGIGLAGFAMLSAMIVVWPVVATRAHSTSIEGSRA
ncbi:MAG TPA: MFS transporter [Thermomicrobiales bacterium]|nr:MFS transporter [Thermomicrobiales bacterium]